MEKALVARASLPFDGISAAGLRGKNPVVAARGLWQLTQGFRQSLRLVKDFQPDAVFVTGGYVCVPVTLAAYRAGIPILIYLPDIEPGFAIKFLSRFATRVAVTTAETQQFFKPGLTVVTGYPVRAKLFETHTEARQHFNLQPDLPTLLVFGGSRGARSINRAITENIEAYLNVGQVIHITGNLDIAWVQARRDGLSKAQQARYYVAPYLHEAMPLALHAADVGVSRAGASVLGEFPAVGLAAILVPYPYAGAHQKQNAAYLERHGAAVVINDSDLQPMLKETIVTLLTQPQKLQAMRQASRALAQPQAAQNLAQAILEVAHAN